MFEFTKLCNSFENLNVVERGAILAEKSVKVLGKLKLMAVPGIDPVETLSGFIIGSVVADGRLNEQEYLLIYPALLKAFGDDFDFASVKSAFAKDRDGRKAVRVYTESLLSLLADIDEDFREDIVTLCLCVVTVDGKISFREKNYIRRLCKA